MSNASQDPGPYRSYSSEIAAGAGVLAPQGPASRRSHSTCPVNARRLPSDLAQPSEHSAFNLTAKDRPSCSSSRFPPSDPLAVTALKALKARE